MALGKQAKVLSAAQQRAVLAHVEGTRHGLRNRVIFLLSVKAGLRAKEIAGLTWSMVSDASGEIAQTIELQDVAAKGRSGRSIPLNAELRDALIELRRRGTKGDWVVDSERGWRVTSQVIVNMMRGWYLTLGFTGCSSHSGRRTFITNAARRIGQVGGSLRDVQEMAGHSSLAITQRYIEASSEARAKLVNLV